MVYEVIDGITFCASSEDSDKVHVFPAILNHSSSVEQYPERQPQSAHKLSRLKTRIFDRTFCCVNMMLFLFPNELFIH